MSTSGLAQIPLAELAERLASRAPVPGGGSAAALVGALAAALVEMVAELTVQRPEYADVAPIAGSIGAAASDLRHSLLAAADEDAAAYQGLVDARRLPRETEADRAARAARIRTAAAGAARAPLHIAQLAAEVLGLADRIAPIGNRNAASDAGVAGLLASAALQGAVLNVRINLPALAADDPLLVGLAAQLSQLDVSARDREQSTLAAVNARMDA